MRGSCDDNKAIVPQDLGRGSAQCLRPLVFYTVCMCVGVYVHTSLSLSLEAMRTCIYIPTYTYTYTHILSPQRHWREETERAGDEKGGSGRADEDHHSPIILSHFPRQQQREGRVNGGDMMILGSLSSLLSPIFSPTNQPTNQLTNQRFTLPPHPYPIPSISHPISLTHPYPLSPSPSLPLLLNCHHVTPDSRWLQACRRFCP